MANRVIWYNADKTVVLQQYYGDYTKDDLYAVVKKSAEKIVVSQIFYEDQDLIKSACISNCVCRAANGYAGCA